MVPTDGSRGYNPPVSTKYGKRFYLMRHGRSLANEAGLIVSDPREGAAGWGLASDAAGEIALSVASSFLQRGIRIVSSPFLRAMETAELAAEILGSPPPLVDQGFRERFFGRRDGGPDRFYAEVWAADRGNPDNDDSGVESPSRVLARMLEALEALDGGKGGSEFLIVSHGDPLNILLAHAAGLGPERHKEIRGMATAEIRPLFPVNASSPGG